MYEQRITKHDLTIKKSKVMLVSRRKMKENKNITVYLNNKPLNEFTEMKYLGNTEP